MTWTRTLRGARVVQSSPGNPPHNAFDATMRGTSSHVFRIGRYVPDSTRRRALAFFLLFVYHSAHTLGRTCAMALLAQVSWLFVVVYTVVDHVVYQSFKLMHGDFIYWMPGVGGSLSSLARFVAKVVVDFTGASHVLAPIEIRPGTVCLDCRTGSLSTSMRAWRHLLLGQLRHEPTLGFRLRFHILALRPF
jgi:hypothetical protein